MEKLKTAREAFSEIYTRYRKPEMTIYEFAITMQDTIIQMRQPNAKISEEILMGVGQIINEYFKAERGPLKGEIVQYTDEAKNVYHRQCECIQSFLDGSYNKMKGEENGR